MLFVMLSESCSALLIINADCALVIISLGRNVLSSKPAIILLLIAFEISL